MDKAELKNWAEGRGGGDKVRTALGLVQQRLDSAPGGERRVGMASMGIWGESNPIYGVDMPENIVFILWALTTEDKIH